MLAGSLSLLLPVQAGESTTPPLPTGPTVPQLLELPSERDRVLAPQGKQIPACQAEARRPPPGARGPKGGLDGMAAPMLAELATRTPLLAGTARFAHVHVDHTVRATCGYAQQDAGYGYSGVRGLDALIATLSTPLATPVNCATRLRKDGPTLPAAPGGWSLTRYRPRGPPAQAGGTVGA